MAARRRSRDYIYLGDRPVALLLPNTGALFFLHGDGLDTPQFATNGAERAEWKAAYQPFGAIRPVILNLAQNLRFPGQYADQETGYYHNGFRDYDPTLGRYLESDPIGLWGGLNTYAYALNNPINYFDRLGLDLSYTGGGGLSTPIGDITVGTDGSITISGQLQTPDFLGCKLKSPKFGYIFPNQSDQLAPYLYKGSTPYSDLNSNPYEDQLRHNEYQKAVDAFNAAHPVH
jgi:RHS repeat-associated protein